MNKYSPINTLLLLAFLIASCAVSNPRFFAEVKSTEDPSYGYTAENPITINNADLRRSINASYYYLSRLRTEEAERLLLIERYSVVNPNYEKPTSPVYNKFTGKPLNYGTGSMLDYYILVTENKADTIRLYINPYFKGDVKVPVGFIFEHEQK